MYFWYTGALSDIVCKLFVAISYVKDNSISLPWVAQAIVFKLSLDLGERFGFVATMLGNNSSRISARGCTAWLAQT